MRRPSTWQIITGHPLSAVLIMASGAGMIWGYFVGSVNGWIAILAVIVMASTAQAAERYAKFKAWERDWASSGAGPRRRGSAFRGWRFVFGGMAWMALAALALSPSEPGSVEEAASVLFWIASGAMIIFALVRMARGGQSRAAKADTVSVCLSRSGGTSEGIDSAYAALPEHCRAMVTPTNASRRSAR